MKLIPLDALVAEINRRMNDNSGKQTLPQYFGMVEEDLSILSFINTLEVKEVDLREEIDVYFQKNKNGYNGLLICKKEDFSVIAKHFFELGLRASNPLTWKDMMLIHKYIKDAMNYHLYKMMEGMEGQKVVYEEVLKRFKAQKGE